MKRFVLVILTALTLGITGSASAQFGRNYWYLDADTLKVVNPNWFIAAQNFIPLVGGTTNLFLGYQSGDSITSGTYNLGLGYQSMYYAGAGSYNIGLGYRALSGNYPMPNTSTYNIGLGYEALWNLSDGDEEIGIGFRALQNDTSSNLNVMIGTNAGLGIYNSISSQNIGIGNNVLIGGLGIQPGSQNVVMGNAAAQNMTGSGCVVLGANAATYPENLDSSVVIGFNANWGDRYAGGGERRSVVIGLNAAAYGEGLKNVYVGEYSGYNASGNFNSGDIPFSNTFLGAFSGFSDSTGWNDTYLGAYSGYLNGSGLGNVFLGDSAGYNETGSNKLYIANSSTSSPLIYGDFTGDSLRVNGQLSSSGNIIGYGNATLSGTLNGQNISSAANFTGSLTTGGNLTINGAGNNTFTGTINGQTISNAASFTGTVTIATNLYVGGSGSSIYLSKTNVGWEPAVTSGWDGTNAYLIIGDPSWTSVLIQNNTTLSGNLTVNGTGTNTFAGLIKTGGYVSTASNFSTTSSTLANVTGLSVTIPAAGTYSFEANLFETVATSAGEKFTVTFSGTSSYAIFDVVATTSTVGQSVSNWSTTLGTAITTSSSNVNSSANIRGTITATSAGTITIQYAQNTAQTTANVVQQGSCMRVWQTN